MTKQQIVTQLAVARYAESGYPPDDCDLNNFGKLADKIIEMFPEPKHLTVDGSPLTVSVNGLDDPNSAVSKSLARNFNIQRTK